MQRIKKILRIDSLSLERQVVTRKHLEYILRPVLRDTMLHTAVYGRWFN